MSDKPKITFEKTPVGFRLPRSEAVDRDAVIVDQCRGKQVLHLGCVDHPFLDEKVKSENLLHQKLLLVSRKVWGIDINSTGVRLLSKHYRIPHLIIWDVEKIGKLKRRLGEIDIVVAGEILEHVNNPGNVLEGINSILLPGGALIVTVPNALALRIWVHTLAHRENIHPDHVAYYSPYTMTSLLERHGFDVKSLYTYWYPSTRPFVQGIKHALLSALSRHWSFLGDGLIAVARKR